MQMGDVAQGWLVYQLTGSALALGWVSSGWSIATTVLSIFAGTISDRMDKRQMLLWARWLMVGSVAAVAALVALGVIQLWHLVVYSLFRGVLFAVIMPAQNAYLSELVDRSTLMNAVSLNSVGMGLAGIVCSSLAGLMIETFGVASVYASIALLETIGGLTLSRLPSMGHADPSGRSVWFDVREGVRYLGMCPILIPLLALVFVRGLLAMPYRTFMPKYAEDVMHLDARGLGILLSAPGVGSLISSLVLAAMGNFRGKGRLLLAGGVVLGLSLVLFANIPQFWWVLVLLGVVGATGNVCMVTNQALLQITCDSPYLGRVMAMNMMMFGLTQLVTIPAGAFADRFGVSIVITVQGGLFALIFALVWILMPKIRRLD
jgi:MFS family permease